MEFEKKKKKVAKMEGGSTPPLSWAGLQGVAGDPPGDGLKASSRRSVGSGM